jgi:geranylgeranyl diphosphate synthase type I
MFHSSGLPDEALARAVPYLHACKNEVVAGQFLDLASSAAGDGSVDVAMQIVRYKAAKYTVERPLHLGASLAGAGEPLLAALSGYGVPVGEAFQLRDDVLGVFGDAAVTGKPAGDDLREGKRTVLLARSYDTADAAQRAALDASVGEPGLDDAAIAELREIIVATGALARVEQQIEDLSQTGLAALESAAVADEDAREALRALVWLAIRRER